VINSILMPWLHLSRKLLSGANVRMAIILHPAFMFPFEFAESSIRTSMSNCFNPPFFHKALTRDPRLLNPPPFLPPPSLSPVAVSQVSEKIFAPPNVQRAFLWFSFSLCAPFCDEFRPTSASSLRCFLLFVFSFYFPSPPEEL